MKYSLVIVSVMLATSAFASSKNVPVPPKRPAAPTFITDPNVYGAYVKDGQVYIRAPVGSDTQVDVDGTNVDVSVSAKNGWNKILPWNWF